MNTEAIVRTHFPTRFVQAMNQLICSSKAIHAKSRVDLVTIAIDMGIAVAPLGSLAETFDIRTGAWEVTETTAIEGMLLIRQHIVKP